MKYTVKSIADYSAAFLFLFVILCMWISLVVVKFYITIPVTIISRFKDVSNILGVDVHWKRWAINIWAADDQNVNAMLGGNRDITISSRVGYKSKEGNNIASIMEVVINWLFFISVGEVDHCRNAIERDEKHNKYWGK